MNEVVKLSPEEAYRKYSHIIIAVLGKFKYSGNCWQDDLVSAAQATLWKLCTTSDKINEENFGSYVWASMYNTMADTLRRVTKNRGVKREILSLDCHIFHDGSETWKDALVDESPSPEAEFVRNSTHQEIRTALERLPAKEKQMLTMYFFDGKDGREIGNELGFTGANAWAYITKGVKRLRKEMKRGKALEGYR